MAIKKFRPGKTTIIASTRNSQRVIPRPLAEMPGGLYPLRMALWETDEYRIGNGWPRSVPTMDIRARTLVSAEGEALAYRESVRDVSTGATVRWISDVDSYDLTALKWYPMQADAPVVWETGTEYAPTYIDDYEYQLETEMFHAEVINFDADSYEHMWTNLTPLLGGTSAYTVIMCLSLNSVYGNSLDVPYSGLWCPGYPTPAIGQPMADNIQDGWFSLMLQGNTLYLETDQTRPQKALSITHLLDTAAPVMIALTVNRPTAMVYAGRGPSTISRQPLNVGDVVKPLDPHIALGRTPGDILHTADMSVLDIGIYPEVLTPSEVKEEFALLSSVYGGDK